MSGYAHPETLVETDWLAEHAADPNVRVFEVDVDTSAYEQGHVAGAIGLNWKTDLQQHPVRDLISKEQLEALLSRSGTYYGHKDVRLVNGGRVKWLAEGRPVTTDIATHAAAQYKASAADGSVRALRAYVLEAVAKNGRKLVDVRSPKEFSGELLAPENLPQEGAQRGGHITGAVNVPWATAVGADGRFKAADELRRIYADQGLDGSTETIAYCRIGERSSHTWFVLKYLLGHDKVRNYDGSWTEYGSLIGAPIESGA